MTDEERQLIQGLADRIRNAPAPPIDRDADTLIRQSIGTRPDALYILIQTVLIQEMALNQAKTQIEQLKAQQPPASFLGNAAPPPPPAPANPNAGRSWGGDNRAPQTASGYQASPYRTGYQPPQPPPLPPQYASDPQPSGFSSFLHSAAETAAGVVAGEVAFSALSSIFGGHHGGGGFFGGGGYVSPVSETIINNNYYDDDRGRGSEAGRGFDDDRDLQAGGLSPDLEDRRFADADSNSDSSDDTDTSNSDSFDDDTSNDDDSADDSTDDSSYDDSGDSN
jgi:hypothetical protein